jgi:hypothetical protein
MCAQASDLSLRWASPRGSSDADILRAARLAAGGHRWPVGGREPGEGWEWEWRGGVREGGGGGFSGGGFEGRRGGGQGDV